MTSPKNVYTLLLLLLGICLFTACPPTVDPDPVDLTVNPAFDQNPPIADQVFLEKVDGQEDGNFLLTARFPERELAKLDNRQELVMTFDEEMVVLRDDGKEGDREAGDGLFSIVLKEDENEINQLIDQINANLEETDKNTPLWFAARTRLPELPRIINRQTLIDLGRVDITDFVLFPKVFPDPKLKDHSLMITDIGVIEDTSRTIPNPCLASPSDTSKAWTFARLMSDMANPALTGVTASEFTLRWLEMWATDQTVNNQTVPARPNINALILDPWKANSNFAVTGELAMHLAPFKLIAIVNRMDLGGSTGYGASDAGEGRFVFVALDANCNPVTNFTVIFEYKINIKGCTNIRAYAKEWYDLKNMVLGSPAYNAALETITDRFALPNTNPANPNGSSISQIRTNENALHHEWELREFVICNPADSTLTPCADNHLVETTVKMEPASRYNRFEGAGAPDMKILADWANLNSPAIRAFSYDVPREEALQPFLAGHSPVPNPSTVFDGQAGPGAGFITDDSTRFVLSLNTCKGCHAGETNTFFQHILPSPIHGLSPGLSGFLTGITVTDPVRPIGGPPHNRQFADLDRRAVELQQLANGFCKPTIFEIAIALRKVPLKMSH